MAPYTRPPWRRALHRARVRSGVIVAVLVLGLIAGLVGAAPSPRVPTVHAPPGPAATAPAAVDAGPTPLAASAGAEHAPAVYNLSYGMAWSRISASAPPGFAGAGFVAMAPAGDGVLFGGQNASVPSNSTDLYNESANAWTPLHPVAAPSPRSDFAFAANPAGTLAVLFGGLTDPATGQVANDTWIFSLANDSWTNVTSSVAPAPRQNAALAVGNGTAFLYGGWSQNVSGLGEITYSDTWALNLTTDAWTRVAGASGSGPGPVHGASMLYDPTLGEFLLFGGCYPCTSAVYSISTTLPVWSLVYVPGGAPPPRMDAAWTYLPDRQLVALFGGTNGLTALNDTYLFDPAFPAWTLVQSPLLPPARARMAAGYLDVPGNATLFLTGGTSGGSAYAGAWRLAYTANVTVIVANQTSRQPIPKADVALNGAKPILTNATGVAIAADVTATGTTINVSALGYENTSVSRWIAPGSNPTVWFNLTPVPPSRVVVTVDALNGTAIPGAFVNLTVAGKLFPGSPAITNRTGGATFLGVPATEVKLSVSRSDFHPDNVTFAVPSGMSYPLTVYLSPLLELSVRTLGQFPNGTVVPLEFVSLSLNNGPGNLTGLGGYRNLTTDLIGLTVLHARLFGFNPVAEDLVLNYTGVMHLRITLIALGLPAVTVQAFLSGGGARGGFIEDATVSVASVTPLPTGPYRASFGSGLLGSVRFFLVPGNYSLIVSAPGCESNESVPIVFAVPGAPIYVPVGLDPLPLVAFHVLVESAAAGHAPIPGARVALRYEAFDVLTGNASLTNLTLTASPWGWANASGIPQSTLLVNASAPGYLTNISATYVAYGEAPVRYVTWLAPIPTVAANPEGLRIVPANAGDVWALFALPSLGILGAIVYLTLLRTPERFPIEEPPGRAPGASTPSSAPRAP